MLIYDVGCLLFDCLRRLRHIIVVYTASQLLMVSRIGFLFWRIMICVMLASIILRGLMVWGYIMMPFSEVFGVRFFQ